MKIRLFALVLIFISALFQISCSTLEANETPANPEWEEVEAKYKSLESEKNFTEMESYSKELFAFEWAKWQINQIKFMLASALYNQQKYGEALKVLEELKDVAPFTHKTHVMAGNAALAEKNYNDALKWIFSVYLKLEKEPKLAASKTVFFAYLYSKRFDAAARWYNEFDDEKKANLQPEFDAWLNESEENRRNFNNALNGNSEPAAEEEQPKTIENIIQEADKNNAGEAAEPVQESAENIEESPTAAVFEFDGSYVPDWKKVCIALSSNDKWSKYNEVIKTYINWHLEKFDKNGIKPEFIEYESTVTVDDLIKKAKEIKCFAIIGPFFAPEFAESFIEKSAEYSIPVISYIPFGTNPDSLFFNVRQTKDLEAENLVKYAVSEREKTKFAIAYIDDANGRALRDTYWKKIEDAGGQVTDIIDISPADRAYKDDVEKVVGKQDNYDEAIRAFKWRNKEKFTTNAIMNRAVDSFIKRIPGKCNFEVLVVLTDPKQTASLLPAFPYLNVEFAYFQKYLNRAVTLKKQELRKDGYDWDIQQILVLGPSEMLNSTKNIEELDKLIDGMVIFSPRPDTTEKNEKYLKISKAFKDANNRSLYFAETIAAEVTDTVLSALAASQKSDMGNFVEALKNTSYTSLISGKAVKFDELNRMAGSGEILIGRKKEPFMTKEEIEEELKRKAEEKLKEGKPEEAENDAPEN
ncbi:ABC transporter substrate-binding protein [bacterium]|nr:ABC transporter substrate-binding protein [bacterium]